MKRKFHTKKHSKKHQQHLIGHDQLRPHEKMAELKEKIDSTEKTEQTVNITPPAVAPLILPPPFVPVMAQRTFQFTKEKSRFEKLKDKFRQLINHFN